MEEYNVPAEGYAFPVDLDKAEYVRFNMRMAKERGIYRFRGVMLLAFGLCMAAGLVLMVMDMVQGRPFDGTLLSLLVFILLAGAVLLFGVPNYIRITAERTYDRTQLCGYDFYGVVRVYPDRVEKTAAGRTTVIRLKEKVAYFEYDDMMVLLTTDQPAIVLSARCVTEEDAEVVRRTVRARVPETLQRLYAKMVSQTPVRLEMPESGTEPVEDEMLMRLRVNYAPDEFLTMVTHGALHSFARMIPMFAGVSLVAALALGLSGGPFVMAGLFLLTLLILFAVNVLGPWLRTKLRLPAMSDDALTVWLVLSERGVTLESTARNTQFYPWLAVSKVVEKPDWYEFHMHNAILEVPARCVTEVDSFKDIVNAHIRRG